MTEAPAFERPFVAIDGEAAGEAYVLLAASTGAHVWNRKGLPTIDCLDFLLSFAKRTTGARHSSILVAFGLDYDVNMMLGDVRLRGPQHSIADLYLNGWTYWKGYRLRYIPRKMFGLSGLDDEGRKQSVTVYDVWSFFGRSFTWALESYGIEIPELVREGKEARGTFASWPKHKLVAYNAEECRLLVELCDRLRDSLRPVVRITSWHGPGAVAGAWLAERRAERWLRRQPTFPGRFEEAVTRAYFGGRIDAGGWGEVDPVHHYDIASAYPAAAARLPDLSELRWRRFGRRSVMVAEERPDLLRVRWKVPPGTRWGPLPWRSHDGTILWPLDGEGWYWSVEVAAAIRRFGEAAIEVLEGYLAGGRLVRPLKADIERAYAARSRLRQAGDPREVAHKLVLNSIYGKFAQTVGKPRYHSWEWAGLITATTRAQLADAIGAVGEEHVVLVMTDGLWATRPPPRRLLGAGLGAWTKGPEVRLWLAEPGLYRAQAADGTLDDYHRGYEAAIDIPDLVARWHRQDFRAVPAAPTRFIGMGPAVVIDGVYKWRAWQLCERRIEPVPIVGTTKRGHMQWRDENERPGFVPLQPLGRDEDALSYPYEPTIIDEATKRQLLEDECAEDSDEDRGGAGRVA